MTSLIFFLTVKINLLVHNSSNQINDLNVTFLWGKIANLKNIKNRKWIYWFKFQSLWIWKWIDQRVESINHNNIKESGSVLSWNFTIIQRFSPRKHERKNSPSFHCKFHSEASCICIKVAGYRFKYLWPDNAKTLL